MTKKPATLAEYVQQARERAGLSQRKLALEAGIHHSRLAAIESGLTGNRPTPEHLQRIADVLNIDVSEMLAYLGVKPALLEPKVYFRKAYGMTAAEAAEAEAVIAELRAHRQQNRGNNKNHKENNDEVHN